MERVTVYRQLLEGERALFKSRGLDIVQSTFANGESPLKESEDITLRQSMFKWKYPLWYCKNIVARDCVWFDTARAGVWYTSDVSVFDSVIEAPKNFRRSTNVTLDNVQFADAAETLWNCDGVTMRNVVARGDYFAMGSTNIDVDGLVLDGNYGFDGCRDVVIKNARLLTKDAFWNCENVTVYDSAILGQYLGWNSKNVRLVNCVVESEQGMCYMDNLVMENCTLLNSDLVFEYATVDADIRSSIVSVKNPTSGHIRAQQIGEIIFDDPAIDPSATRIELGDEKG